MNTQFCPTIFRFFLFFFLYIYYIIFLKENQIIIAFGRQTVHMLIAGTFALPIVAKRHARLRALAGVVGFEPTMSCPDRLTVYCLRPLGYTPLYIFPLFVRIFFYITNSSRKIITFTPLTNCIITYQFYKYIYQGSNYVLYYA